MHDWFHLRSFGRFYTRHSYAAYNKSSRNEWSSIHEQYKYVRACDALLRAGVNVEVIL